LGDLLLIVVLPFFLVFFFAFYLFFSEKLPPYIPLFLVLSSFISVLSALIIQHYLTFFVLHLLGKENHFYYTIFNSFVYSATIEEISKIFFFFLSCNLLRLTSRFKVKLQIEKTQQVNILSEKTISVLAMFFASSFAAFETVGYSIHEPKLLFLRLLTATLLHIFISPIYVGIFKKKVLSSIALSIAIHGTYNFLVDASNITIPLSFCLLILLLLKTIHNLKNMRSST